MSAALATATSPRRRALLLLVVVFIAGVTAGITGDRVMQPRMVIKTRLESRLPEILARLKLTPDQRRQADSILAQSNPRAEAAMRELAPRLAAIADSVHVELRRILTAPQAATLDSLAPSPLLILKRKGPGRAGARVDTVFRR